MNQPTSKQGPATWAIVEVEVEIRAAPQRVWKALVVETAAWWRGEFLTAGTGSRFVIEPRVGGRLFEDRGEGNGLLWGTVVTIDPPHLLEFTADVFPRWGGPLRSQVSVRLTAVEDRTRLTLVDALIGRLADATASSLDAGWKKLFGHMLRDYAESAASA